eukprot:1080760-Amorphochlora_amoeboformis.AAC.2
MCLCGPHKVTPVMKNVSGIGSAATACTHLPGMLPPSPPPPQRRRDITTVALFNSPGVVPKKLEYVCRVEGPRKYLIWLNVEVETTGPSVEAFAAQSGSQFALQFDFEDQRGLDPLANRGKSSRKGIRCRLDSPWPP